MEYMLLHLIFMPHLVVILHFFQNIFQIIASETQGILICGSDLNIHLQPELDSLNKKITTPKTIHRKMNALMNDIGIIDIWRDRALCVSSANVMGSIPREHTYWQKMYNLNALSVSDKVSDKSKWVYIYESIGMDNKKTTSQSNNIQIVIGPHNQNTTKQTREYPRCFVL